MPVRPSCGEPERRRDEARHTSLRAAILLPVAALVLLAPRLAAQAEVTVASHGTEEGPHVFWRLDKPAGGHLFLLGSLHFGDDRLHPLPAVVEKAYESATVVVFETDLRQTQQPSIAEVMRRKAELTTPASLADLIPPETLESFRRVAVEMGLDPGHLERFRAWYAANHLMTAALRRANLDPLRGIDQVFCARAVHDGKAIETLETPEFQVDLFAGLDDRQGAALLAESLVEVGQVREFVERMLAAYLHGDLAGLEELVTASFDGVPALRQRFLVDRNTAWLTALAALAQRPGDQLIIVGAGHLLGGDGLVTRLQGAGFRLSRL